MTTPRPELLALDSPEDLVLRGHHRDEVKARTGVDVGYNANSVKKGLAGIDRWGYKLAQVEQRVPVEVVEEALALYETGVLGVEEFLAALGLANPTLVKLKKLFAEVDDGRWAEKFAAVDKARRRATMAAGMTAKHGVDNPFKAEVFQEKAAATRTERYGAAYTLAEGSSLAEEARQTFAERMADPVFREDLLDRRRRTRRENHPPLDPIQGPSRASGWHPVSQSEIDARVSRARQTSLERYGVEHFSKSEGFKARVSEFMRTNGRELAQKARETNLRRYGVVNSAALPERRAAQSERMRDPEHQVRILEARKKNGTMNTSAVEKALGERLREIFPDLVCQYRDERYSFACDFYVPSRDLFIELNGSWTHGGHWYDEGSAEDRELAAQWRAKSASVSEFYEPVTWTKRDVAKRAAAAKHGLNYVVLWDGSEQLLDAKLWIALGCPDGRDWEREYSWLPERAELDLDGDWPALGDRRRTATAVARRANWRIFYARELALWEADGTSPRRWGRTRARLYANRLEHMGAVRGTGKLPTRLSDLEILRGLGISGAVRAYTVFDNTAMKAVLDRYGPTSVYDPCAGWGERMVTCAARGIEYLGVDVSREAVAGHGRIAAHYDLRQQRTVCADAAVFDARDRGHEMVFTCPPYGSTEIYTADGAENLDDEAFLAWWAQVVAMSTGPATQVFACQINRAWAPRMNAVLEQAGWKEVEVVGLGHQSGHFTRGKGGVDRKVERESVHVFERKV